MDKIFCLAIARAYNHEHLMSLTVDSIFLTDFDFFNLY